MTHVVVDGPHSACEELLRYESAMKAVREFAFCSIVALCVACGDDGWVDGSVALSVILCGDSLGDKMAHERMPADRLKQLYSMESAAICKSVGKTSTGELRCEDGKSQVKCK